MGDDVAGLKLFCVLRLRKFGDQLGDLLTALAGAEAEDHLPIKDLLGGPVHPRDGMSRTMEEAQRAHSRGSGGDALGAPT